VKLLAFLALAVLVHGPLSPFLPTAFEATLLYYARFHPAWLLALGGTAAASLAEAVNYRLVSWAAAQPKLVALSTGKVARWSIAAFLRAPFWTTVLVIFSPLPDSAVRILAPRARCCAFRCCGCCSRAARSCSRASGGGACSASPRARPEVTRRVKHPIRSLYRVLFRRAATRGTRRGSRASRDIVWRLRHTRDWELL